MNAIGNGVYTYGEASRLIGVSPQRLRAWFKGWPHGGSSLFTSDYERGMVSFLDLVDAAVAAALRKNVSIHAMKKLTMKLSQLWSTPHPFSRQEFYTDKKGCRIFIEIMREEKGSTEFIEILENQHAMPEVLKPILNHIEFDPSTRFAQIIPLTHGVILDPRRRYGKPIVKNCGMPTEILFNSYHANNQNADLVADWYGVSREDVENAIRFETSFSGIAA